MNNKEITFANNTWFTGASRSLVCYPNDIVIQTTEANYRANLLLPPPSTPKTHSSVLLTLTDSNKEKQAPSSKQFTRQQITTYSSERGGVAKFLGPPTEGYFTPLEHNAGGTTATHSLIQLFIWEGTFPGPLCEVGTNLSPPPLPPTDNSHAGFLGGKQRSVPLSQVEEELVTSALCKVTG